MPSQVLEWKILYIHRERSDPWEENDSKYDKSIQSKLESHWSTIPWGVNSLEYDKFIKRSYYKCQPKNGGSLVHVLRVRFILMETH